MKAKSGLPAIEIKGLSVYFEERAILSDITLCLMKGTINVLIGSSGCGKTTLCRCLTGIIPSSIKATSYGEIRIRGEDICDKKLGEIAKIIGFVMQEPDHQLIASTVEDDLAFGPENMCVPPGKIRNIVDEMAEIMGFKHLLLRWPGGLSGGEKQRVTTAGILALNPDILIFDEPMSHLDEAGKEKLLSCFQELKNQGKTLFIVEHDYLELDFADEWILMGDGKIMDRGKPEVLKARFESRPWHY